MNDKKSAPEITTPQSRAEEEAGRKIPAFMEALAATVNMDARGYDRATREITAKTAGRNLTEIEFNVFMATAARYKLDPLVGQIFAFKNKSKKDPSGNWIDGGISICVPYKGWCKIVNEHPDYDGYDQRILLDANGNFDGYEGTFYRKSMSHPIKFTVYFREFNRPELDTWKLRPIHQTSLKCYSHGAARAFGMSDISAMEWDEIASYGEAHAQTIKQRDLPTMTGPDDAEPAAPQDLTPAPAPAPVSAHPPANAAPVVYPPAPPVAPAASSASTQKRLPTKPYGALRGLFTQHTGLKKPADHDAWELLMVESGYPDLQKLLDDWSVTNADKTPKEARDLSLLKTFMARHPELGAKGPAAPVAPVGDDSGWGFPDAWPENEDEMVNLYAEMFDKCRKAALAKNIEIKDLAFDLYTVNPADLSPGQWRGLWIRINSIR